MGLNYRDLDERTRQLMIAEINRDMEAGTLFVSDNLTPQGKSDYPDLIRRSARDGNDDSLATALSTKLNSHEKPRQLKSGKLSKPPVMPSNAHERLAEGEFNRFYIRAVCLRAIELGQQEVIAYRAKEVQNPRPASLELLGTRLRAEVLLEDLRASPGVDTALGLPPGPNSGLSVTLPSEPMSATQGSG